MGRPKKGAAMGRKPLAKKDTNVPVAPQAAESTAEEELKWDGGPGSAEEAPLEDPEERMRIVNLVCDAVGQEVEARSAAIRAIRDGHIASVTTQLQLLLSKFPAHIRKMPMKRFLREYCPNTKAEAQPDGSLRLDILQDPAAHPAVEGGFRAITGEFQSCMHNTPGFGPHGSLKEQLGQSVSKQLASQKKDKEQLSWDEFLAAYRMQSAAKGLSAWETPSLRTPSMNWRDTMVTRNMTPMTEKVFPSLQPSQIGTVQAGGTKRKVPASRGLRM